MAFRRVLVAQGSITEPSIAVAKSVKLPVDEAMHQGCPATRYDNDSAKWPTPVISQHQKFREIATKVTPVDLHNCNRFGCMIGDNAEEIVRDYDSCTS